MKNTCSLIGHIGKEIELRHTQSGTAYAKTSLATTENVKNKEGSYEKKTSWHNLIIWGPQSERFKNWLQKGSKVDITGSIVYGSYEASDGSKRYTTDIRVDRFINLDPKKTSNQSTERVPETDQFTDQDIPF